jgi:uncharacterized protein (TIGR03083 family)
VDDDGSADLPPPDVVGAGSIAADPLQALREECEEVSRFALGLPEEDFSRQTRCTAWNVKELLGHLYWDLHRMKRWLEAPAADRADTDSVSYWRSYDALGDAPGIADRAAQRAAGYETGNELAKAWDELWRDAIRSAESQDWERVVATWGPKLTMDDFLRTRVLEVTAHRMDLQDALGQKGWGTDAAISIVDDALEGLLGVEPPSELEWDVVDFIEAGAGRRPLTEKEREILGPLADRFPLLG